MTARPVPPHEPSPWLRVTRRSAPGWFLSALTLTLLAIGVGVLGLGEHGTPTETLLPALLMTPVR